jgi:hypothetical protein
MSAATLDKRLHALEENSVCRIETLADYALWRTNPNRHPNPEFSPVMRECLESFRAHTMEKKRLAAQDEGAGGNHDGRPGDQGHHGGGDPVSTREPG